MFRRADSEPGEFAAYAVYKLYSALILLRSVEGKDIFGEPIPSTVVIDISDVIDGKAEMLACHRSEREWLQVQHGMDEYIEAMKRWSADLGSSYDTKYAEGFRQHRGHAYPNDDLLGNLLSNVADRAMTRAHA